MQRTSSARTAAAAAVLFGICFFLTVASVNVPHTSSDARLLAWWRVGSNVQSGLISLFFAACTAVLFAVVVNYVLSLVGPASQVQTTAFARSMAGAFTATLLVSAAVRGVVGHLVQVQDEPLPRVDVLRYSTALNYTLMGMIAMAVFALTVLAIAVIVLRTEVLARWVGYVGLGCGVVVLVAAIATFGQFTVPIAIIWSWCTAVAIWRQPAPTAAAVSAAQEPAVA
jgi:hypothetical protein